MGRSAHQEAGSAWKACASISSPKNCAYAAMMHSNWDLLRVGAGNLARLGLTVCDLLHLREAVHDWWWHNADFRKGPLFVRFSNRPSGSSTFRLTTTPVSMSLTGSRFSSDSAPRPFHHGDSKTRWNNLSGGLAVNMTAGPSGQTISPHPSSREGHHSTARWSSISSYRI